jgi:hypothetical protein
MKIQFVAGPKSGTTEHIDNQTGRTLIASGFALEVPPAPRGTNAWLKEMAEQESRRVDAIPPSQRENFSVDRWEVATSVRTADENITIVKHSGGARYFYKKGATISDKDFKKQMLAAGCPLNIVDRYLQFLSEQVDPEIAAERRVQQFNRDYAAAQVQNAREAGATATLLGKDAQISQEQPR